MDSLVEWILLSQPYIGIVWYKSSLPKTSSFLEDKSGDLWIPLPQFTELEMICTNHFILLFSSLHSHHFILCIISFCDYQIITLLVCYFQISHFILLFSNHPVVHIHHFILWFSNHQSIISKSFISFSYFQIILWYTFILRYISLFIGSRFISLYRLLR